MVAAARAGPKKTNHGGLRSGLVIDDEEDDGRIMFDGAPDDDIQVRVRLAMLVPAGERLGRVLTQSAKHASTFGFSSRASTHPELCTGASALRCSRRPT